MKKGLVLAGIAGYLYQMDPRIHVEFKGSKEMSEILDKCPSLQNYFYATPWLFNGIFQGFYGMGPGSSSNIKENVDYVEYEREFFQLKDSGLMSIDWKFPRQKTNKILLIIPGLSGGSHSEYVRTAVNASSREGFDVGVIHGRGIAGTPIKSFKFHHLCANDDIQEIISEVHQKYPNHQLFGLGTSMGAGLILRYASTTREKCLFKGIVAVAAPFDYIECRAKLNSIWPYFGYADDFIVKSLTDQVKSVLVYLKTMEDDLKEKGIDIERVLNIKTSREFDEEFTVKMIGIDKPEDYYIQASVGYNLNDIKVPTLSLNSEDDPIVPFNKEFARQIISNHNILLVYTKLGGHVGFYTGIKPKRWYVVPCLEFLKACSD